MTDGSGGTFAERIEAIEEAYEYLLAYAAQGLDDDSGPGESAREFLTRAEAAMDELAESAAREATPAVDPTQPAWADYLALLREDAERARISVRLVLAQPRISSALVDNFNASIHVRTLLTDVFLIDESLKSAG